jgi:hypothetical protein
LRWHRLIAYGAPPYLQGFPYEAQKFHEIEILSTDKLSLFPASGLRFTKDLPTLLQPIKLTDPSRHWHDTGFNDKNFSWKNYT